MTTEMEIENDIINFEEISLGRRLAKSLKSDIFFLLLIFLIANAFLSFEQALFYFGIIISLYIIEVSLWSRYYLIRIHFAKDRVYIKYRYFNRLHEINVNYEDLTIDKERVWYKRIAQYYLNFKLNGKSIIRQHVFGKINSDFMDQLVNKYLALRSERR